MRQSGPDPSSHVTLFAGFFRPLAPRFDAGWSSPVARQAHNLKVTGSNPVPAPKYLSKNRLLAF